MGNPECPIPFLRWLLLIPTLVVLVAMGLATYGAVRQLSASEGSPGLRTAALIARESMGRVLVLALWPLGALFQPAPRRRADGEEDRVPVLLVPGYGTNRSALWFLTAFLGHRGWPWLWRVNHSGSEVPLEGQARDLHRKLLELKRATGAEQVDIVGFSMGGLVAAWYVSHGPGAEHVRRLVTVGSPWRGTHAADHARTAVGEQLRYDSPALSGLDATRVPTISIYSPDDPMIVPASSAVPPGCRTVQVDGAGHLDMLLNARVFRAVQQALEADVLEEAA